MRVDGYIRDWPKVRNIGLPLRTVGVTPHYASRLRLAEGSSIGTYYPLNVERQREYDQWRADQDRAEQEST